ncbi:MAG: peptidoglycan editing factor PgeF [Ancalomicrobiaceae bacterium]|nr:peptidoglycan editing factor PgeF [Ancalomicrobiaceae bacterium]
MIQSSLLGSHSAIRHEFFTREGGVSSGLYRSLNIGLGSSDDRALVIENRGRVADRLGVARGRLALPYQVHSPNVWIVDVHADVADPPRADAVVTRLAGTAIGVSTADCGPILFADAGAGVIGAAHAGWKGAIGGVIEATIAAMETQGATRAGIRAVLGPTISAVAYEVGPEFVDRFVAADAGNARYFGPSTRPEHAMFDLPGYIMARLAAAGVGAAENLGLCTYSDESRFFSYRRTTHRGEPDYGRLVSAIAIGE